jgi:hypothetical protein
MSKIEIEVTDNNTFNLGWLLYLLGQDRPADGEADADGFVSDHAADGWDTGKETGALALVRHVFAQQAQVDKPHYIITVGKPKAEPMKVTHRE